MGRGKSLKTKVKEASSLSIPLFLAEKEAEQAAEAKKPIAVILKEQLQHFMSNIRMSDVIEVSAWLGLAYIIKPIIDMSEDLHAKVQIIKISTLQTPVPAPFNWEGIFPIKPLIASWLGLFPAETQAQITKELEKTDWQTWLLALAVSALIIKFGPAILESMGGLTKLAGLLLT